MSNRIRFILFCCFYGIGILGTYAQVPVPDFSASAVAGCGPLSITFTDLSTNTPFSWAWDFGNGQISNQQNPSVTYTTPGTYTVTLIAKNASGANSIRKTDYITVYPYPTPSFTADINVGCAPATVQFTDHSTAGQGTITSWTWDFSDGTTSTQQNPSHVFAQTGYYDVGLTIVNSGGCKFRGAQGRFIRVVPGVQAAFDWSQTSPSCSAPFNINFINQTSGPGTVSYNWDMGNGNTSNQAAPTTTYPSNNTYTVTLIANSSFGCGDTVTKAISFQQSTPVITAPDQACVNAPISFQNGTSPAPQSSSWDFGDGTTAAVANPGKSYATPGTYTVTLTNTYSSCTASATKTIDVVNTPTTSFTSDKTGSCKAPLTVTFKDNNTPNATSWQWDFGDGQTGTGQTISHQYTALGNYTVTLTANTSNNGCTATATEVNYIRVIPASMVLVGGLVQGCISPATVNATASVFALDGVATYAWSSPDATTYANTNAKTATFGYSTEGYHDISVTVTTNDGCTLSQTYTNGVLVGQPVTPQFTATPTDVCADQPVTFSSTISIPVDLWSWKFGDSTTLQTATPPPLQHAFHDTGYQDITLSVYRKGCQQTLTIPQYIHVNAPLAGFKYKIDCINRENVAFTDTSQIDNTKAPLTYLWDFGDGSPTSNVANPAHTFPALGKYTVTETVTNGGCTDVQTTVVNLSSIVPSFTLSPDSVCRNASFTMTSTSTPASAIQYYSWAVNITTLKDSSLATRNTSIANPGDHLISLIVTDSGGCPYTATSKNIHITGPTAKFTPAPGGCRNSPIQFTDQSTPSPYPGYLITSWTLNAGDSTPVSTFTSLPITHSYADTGSYTATLTVTDSKGCTDTVTAATVVRITAPRAGFFAADTVYCPNAALPFTDSSQGNNLVYNWDFGDGGVSGALNTSGVSHAYATDGQYYSVKLKITDGTGCSDSVTRTNYIHIQSPIAAFTMEDSTGICLPLATTFFPQGQYYDSLYWVFGDGTPNSTLDTTAHFYSNFGTFAPTLFLKGAGGCLSSISHNVNVYNPVATGSFTAAPVTGCDSFVVDFQITPVPFTRFTLMFGDGAADSSNNLVKSHKYTFPSTYTPQLSMQDSSGCIVIIGGRSGNIKVFGAIPFFNMSEKKFCDAGTVFFTDVTITNDKPVGMTWNFGDGSPNATGTVGNANENPSHTYTAPGIYFPKLTLNTNNGCSESYTDTVHVYQTPHPVITLPNPSCVNTLLLFQGNLVTPDLVDTINWAWNFGNGQTASEQNPTITYPQAGPYTVSLRTSVSFGCSDTISQSLTINPRPVIKGPAEISTPVGVPVTLPFTYSADADNFSWTPANNLDCTNCPNPVASPIFATRYYVTVTDINSCVSADSILVKTICNDKNYFIPNTFSPNNDGVNDVFYPRGNSLYNIQSMRVFNRWGQMIFERKNFPANSASDGWDGAFNGHPAPPDAYIYIVEVICDNAQVIALKGDVTLIR